MLYRGRSFLRLSSLFFFFLFFLVICFLCLFLFFVFKRGVFVIAVIVFFVFCFCALGLGLGGILYSSSERPYWLRIKINKEILHTLIMIIIVLRFASIM